MDPNSSEWKIWCRLEKYAQSRDGKEIEGLSEKEIRRTLACAQISDKGRAGAYIAGEEVLKEFEKYKEKNEEKKKTYRWIIIGAAGVFLVFLIYLFLRFFCLFNA
jgi:F0F1-type ATP synthase gamma subunit